MAAGSSSSGGGGWLFLVLVMVFGMGWFFTLQEKMVAWFGETEPKVSEFVERARVRIAELDGVELDELIGDRLPEFDVPEIEAGVTPDAPATVPSVPVAVEVGAVAAAPTWDQPFPAPLPADYADAFARLEVAVIEPADNGDGYDRASWMPSGWSGATGGSPELPSGCDVREFMFVQWAQPGSHAARTDCYPTAGRVTDSYVGVTYDITESTARDVEVEHVVALAEAHRSGGNEWDAGRRAAMATDYTIRSYRDGGTELLLVGGSENASKSDSDPGGYLPTEPAYRCGYLVNWVAVKYRLGLSFDAEEVTAVTDGLLLCQQSAVPERP